MIKPKTNIPLFEKPEAIHTGVEAHPLGDAFFENNVATVTPLYDAPVQCGRSAGLGADNDLPIPIHNNGGANSFLTYHDLDTNEVIQLGNAVDGGSSVEYINNGTFDTDTDWTKESGWVIAGGKATRSSTGGNTNIEQEAVTILSSSKTYLASITVSDYVQGTFRFYYLVSAYIPVTSNGTFTIVFNGDDAYTSKYVRGFSDAVGSIDDVSITEILPTSTEYTFSDVTLNNILTHKTALDTASLANIQAEPNLLAELGINGSAVGVNITLDADDSYYAVSESKTGQNKKWVINSAAPMTSLPIASIVPSPDTSGNLTFTPITGGYNVVSVGLSDSTIEPYFGATLATQYTGAVMYLVKIVVKSGTIKTKSFDYYTDAGFGSSYNDNQALGVGTHYTYICVDDTLIDKISIYFDGQTESIYDADITMEILTTDFTTITNYSIGNDERAANNSKGLQTTALVLDGAGVPTAYNSTSNTARVYSDSLINTGFKPNIARYSIDETVSGELQEFGVDTITNGNFNIDLSGWGDSGHWVYDNGEASMPSTDSFLPLYQDTVFTIGQNYLVTFEITELTGDITFANTYTSAGSPTIIGEYNSTGVKTIEFIPEKSSIAFYRKLGVTTSCKIDNVSVKELTTKTQRTERRVLTHNVLDQTRYYIGVDGGAMVEQSVVPALPDPNNAIVLGNTPVIGYPDEITEREANFEIHSEVIVP